MMRAFATVLVALATAAPTAVAQESAPLEPVELTRIPLPAGVTGMSHPDWTPDGSHLVFGFTSEQEPSQHFGLIADDGSFTFEETRDAGLVLLAAVSVVQNGWREA